MRRDHASKIDAWLANIAAKTRHMPHFRSKTRDLGPWFWRVVLPRFGDLPDSSNSIIWVQIFFRHRQTLDSMYLLETL